MKPDLRFLLGLAVGALVVGLVVWFVTGDSESKGGRDAGARSEEPEWTKLKPTAGAPADGGSSASPDFGTEAPTGDVVDCAPTRSTVHNAEELERALAEAKPGDSIRLAPGTYTGEFVTQVSGTKENPIFLCGDQSSVLDGGGIKKGYAFHLNGASFWRLIGFSVQNSQKGVMADGTTHSVIQGLRIHNIGDEAIHLRTFSSDNLVAGNTIWDTGRRRDRFGEGVYLGSAKSNWRTYTNDKPDASDRNEVRGNRIKSTAEAIDIKEGTTGGKIIGNVFDGSAQSGHFNDSWVDVKGNGYLIQGNTGRKTLEDGFQTHEIIKGWGTGNTFVGNTAQLDGGKGVGIKLTSPGNKVSCDNKVSGGELTNEKCS